MKDIQLGVVSKKKKKLMEFSIKGLDPPPLMEQKTTWSKTGLNHLKQTLKSTCYFLQLLDPLRLIASLRYALKCISGKTRA